MTIRPEEAFPLGWPAGWPRTNSGNRRRAKFGTKEFVSYASGGGYHRSSDLTVFSAMRRLTDELGRLGGSALIVSTNVEVRKDGSPMSNRRNPDDPGVAVYFKLKGKDRVLACDRWDRVFDNIAAIAAHIAAIRAVDRYGVGTLDQAFAGYAALPPPSAANRAPWRQVLGLGADPSLEDAEAAFKLQAMVHHPDKGGDPSAFAAISEAIRSARQELRQ